MKTINEVMPIEVLEEVFSYLSIGEKLCYRSVCRLWNAVLSNMRMLSLTVVIRKNRCKPVKSRSFMVYEPVNSINLIELTSDDCLSVLSKEAIFQTVRHMTTFFANYTIVDYTHLENFYNHFVKLESLVIGSNYNIRDFDGVTSPEMFVDKQIFLNLNYLRKLTVDTDFFNFSLRTPELLYLKSARFPFFVSFDQANLVYRDKLKFLDIGCFSSIVLEDYEFPSLEILIIRQRLDPLDFRIHPKLLSLFAGKSLKEVHQSGPVSGYSDSFLKTLAKFREENNKQFEMFFNGIYYERYKDLPQKQQHMHWHRENMMSFLLQSRSIMAKRVYSDLLIEYCQLEHLSDEELNQFVRKFENIKSVSVDRNVANEWRLLEFLEKQSKPTHLEFKHFNQHSELFLNQLGSRCRFLRALTIQITSETPFENFGFLFKLENLTYLKFVNTFSLELAVYILKQLKGLRDLRFHTQLNRLSIANVFGKNGLRLYINHVGKSKCFSNKADCIQFLGDLASKEPRIDLTRFFELLPDNPECQFYGYFSFPN